MSLMPEDGANARTDRPRLWVVSLEESVGAQEARNVGVRMARGPWVAFLDDDDEWLPTKLERQLEAARASRWPHPLVSCGLIAESPEGNFEWPRREPTQKSLAEYLFLRKHHEKSEIRLQTSTLMTTKALLMRVPWRKCMHEGVGPAPPSVCCRRYRPRVRVGNIGYMASNGGTDRLSQQVGTCSTHVEWFHSVRDQVGPRPYASFLLSKYSSWAPNERDWRAFFGLPWNAIRHGSPTLSDILLHVGIWLLPGNARKFIRQWPITGSREVAQRAVNRMKFERSQRLWLST